MRLSSPTMAAAFIEGALAQGCDVVDFGMMATDMLYFAVASEGLEGGAQITASHNPGEYNGIKMVRREALPLSGDAGIGEIRDMLVSGTIPPQAATPADASEHGRARPVHRSHHVVHRPSRSSSRSRWWPMPATAWAASSRRRCSRGCPASVIEMCYTPDGSFPNHEANPLIEENRAHIVERVVAEKADIGIAWDGDADRCFFIDGTGEFISGDFVTALLAEAFLLKHPSATIVYDLRASYAVRDTVLRYGGRPLMNRVGHAFIKRRMRDEDAIFGGEVTGHYYFRDNFYADNGFIPALLMLELMSKKNASLAELLTPLRAKYFISGEINTKVASMASSRTSCTRSRASSATAPSRSWMGCRWSTTTGTSTCARRTPSRCIRLNLEATTQELMERKRDEVLGVIRG